MFWIFSASLLQAVTSPTSRGLMTNHFIIRDPPSLSAQTSMESYTTLPLYRAFRPLFLMATLFGLTWKPGGAARTCLSPCYHTIHCLFLIVLSTFNAARMFASYSLTNENIGPWLLIKVAYHVTLIQQLMSVLCYIYILHRRCPRFLGKYNNYLVKQSA